MASKIEKLIEAIRNSDDETAKELLSKAISKDDLEGMSIVDDPNEDLDDEAAQWLKEQEGKSGTKAEKKARARDWAAKEGLSDEQLKAVQEHLDQGYSEREAHRFAGTHKEHSNILDAMKSGINPSMMSDKMIDQLKPLVGEWLENADRHEKLTADIDKNPMKHASGKMMAAHEEATGHYNKAYHDFLNSEDIKGLKGRERFKAIRDWKKNYREENPDYAEKLSGVSDTQKTFGEARQTAKQSLQDKLGHIMRGGVSTPGVSATEASQHLGQESRGEGMQPSPGTEDISSSFAAKNPKLVNLLNQEHMAEHKDRLNRINSHAQAKGVVRRKKSEEE